MTFRCPLHTDPDKAGDRPTAIVSYLKSGLHFLVDTIIERVVIKCASKIINMNKDFQPAVSVRESEKALVSLCLYRSHFCQTVTDEFVEEAGALLAAVDSLEQVTDKFF